MQPEFAMSNGPVERAQSLVLRNTAYLGIAELLTVPLSVVLNALLGRYLGPSNLGHIYFATTICSAAMLAVGWGHSGPLPAEIARDPTRAGKLLGTSIAFRVAASLLAAGVLAIGCFALNVTAPQRWAIGLVFLASVAGTIVSACQDAIRGFERTDVAAYTRVGAQVLAALLVIPVLLAGGGMRLTLLVQVLSGFLVLVLLMRALRPIGITRLEWNRPLFNKLMLDGTPFVFFQLVLVLQPNIDAFYLAKLTAPNVVGWYAVSQRLGGFLVMPATALIGALYPTLCRLYATDREGFVRTTRESIASVGLVGVPVVLGCALYPDIGVSIFGREAFRPAEDTLRVFAVNLFFVYFSMPIGTALLAAGRQRIWTVVQLICVANSLVLDPILIQHFQERTGNGGIGLPVTATISELIMVAAGIALMPKGVFDRSLAKSQLIAMLAGAAMAGAAFLLQRIPSLLAAALAALTYGAALYCMGAIKREQLAWLWAALRRKLQRKVATG